MWVMLSAIPFVAVVVGIVGSGVCVVKYIVCGSVINTAVEYGVIVVVSAALCVVVAGANVAEDVVAIVIVHITVIVAIFMSVINDWHCR